MAKPASGVIILAALCLCVLHLVRLSTQSTQVFTCPAGYYGKQCNLSCTEHCYGGNLSCVNMQSGGGCTEGCQKGWQGSPVCNETCPKNSFYLNCNRTCHCNDTNEACETKNGNCLISGCHPNWGDNGCYVRLPVLTSPPLLTGVNCSHLFVTFQPFNRTLEVGAVANYTVEAAAVGSGDSGWASRANVLHQDGPFEVWISGGLNSTLLYQVRVRSLYRNGNYEKLGPASNESQAAQLNCLGTTPDPPTVVTTVTIQSETPTASTELPSSAPSGTSTEATASTELPSSAPSGTSTEDNPGSSSSTVTTESAIPPLSVDNTALITTLCVLLFLGLGAVLALLLYWFYFRRDKLRRKSKLFAVAMSTLMQAPGSHLMEPRSARFWSAISDVLEPRRPVFHPSPSQPASESSLTLHAEFESLRRYYIPRRLREKGLKYTWEIGMTSLGQPVVVKGYVRRDAYMVTESPKDASSAGLLWRTVVESNVAQLVALDENKAIFKYCPEEPGEKANYGDVRIRCVAKRRRNEFTVRHLRVNGLLVKQYQLLGALNDPLALLSIYLAVRAAARIEDGPILVHCQTGAGSSYIFIGLDWLLQQAAHEGGAISVYKCVRLLRHSKENAVPHAWQYALLYDAAFEALLRAGFPIVPGGGARVQDAFLAVFDAPPASGMMPPLQEQLDLLIRFGPLLDEKPVIDGAGATNFDSLQEAGAIKRVEAPTTSNGLNAFWLDILRRRVATIVCMDHGNKGAASASGAIFPPCVSAEGNATQKTLDLIDLQVVSVVTDEPLTMTDSQRPQTRSLNLRPRQDRLPGLAAEFVVTLVLLNALDADESLAEAAAAILTAVGDDSGPPWLLVSVPRASLSDERQCAQLAVAVQAGEQLAKDGYADVVGAVRRLRRRQPTAVSDADQYRLIHRCLRHLEIRLRPSARRKGNAPLSDTASILSSTLELDRQDVNSIYDFCQLPVRPRPAHNRRGTLDGTK